MNKRFIRNAASAMCLALFFVFSGNDAFCQTRKSGGGAGGGQAGSRDGIAVKKVEMVKIRTPDYSSSYNEASVSPGEWTRILVRFDTDPEWIDQLEMRFYVVVKNPKGGAFTMLTGTYVYSDIPKGRNHQVAVFLRPRTVERFGVFERAGVEAYSKGEVAGMASCPEDNKAWWRTATNLRTVEGYVIERSQTPFANVASDNYEVPKGK